MIQWIRIIFPEITIDVIFEITVRTMKRDKIDVTNDCDILFTFYGQILRVIAGKILYIFIYTDQIHIQRPKYQG